MSANGIEPDEDQIKELTETAAQAESAWTSAAGGRKAFGQIQDVTAEIIGTELDPVLFADTRDKVRDQFGLSFDGKLVNPIGLTDIGPEAEPEDLLEVEIIAIYW